MLRPLDRTRRDGPLYPGSSRTLRELLEPTHLLLQIEEAIDLAALAGDLESFYDRGRGRPAIHPEVVLRALLLAAFYQVPSYRQLCARISENLAWRYFCHLTLDDPVFDHSTLSVFVERIGAEGVQSLLDRFTTSLAEAGLLSSRLYLDSSLLTAHVRTAVLSPRQEDAPLLTPEGEVFVAREQVPGSPPEPAQLRLLRYQDAKGHLPLPTHDRDARWQTIRKRVVLGYKEHLVVDRSGFILARRSTGADVTDVVGALPLLDVLPVPARSITTDSGYRELVFRHVLRRRGIVSYIPLGRQQITGHPAGFVDHGDHFLCPKGKVLRPSGVPDAHGNARYATRKADCDPCPLRATCLAPSQQSKILSGSIYRREIPRAQAMMTTTRYATEQERRKTIVEGVFARLDRLGGIRLRVRGLERVNSHNALAALAHTILKALTKRRFWRRDGAVLPHPAPAPQVVEGPVRTRCLGGVSFLLSPLPHL